jgi:hypothetical protein
MSFKDNSIKKSLEFDIANIHVNDALPIDEHRQTRVRYAAFLKGPISWAWIKAATEAGRNALFVGLNLHKYRDIRRRDELRLSLQRLGDGILSRQAVRHALRQMESSGLINIGRTPGRLLAITILETVDDSRKPPGNASCLWSTAKDRNVS